MLFLAHGWLTELRRKSSLGINRVPFLVQRGEYGDLKPRKGIRAYTGS